ncbi:MAG: hypothetical protein LBS27_05435 [Bifidobacteriaceae bacterium]|nr:hypothetical protein [Bifidobacteriaceae bacterium]
MTGEKFEIGGAVRRIRVFKGHEAMLRRLAAVGAGVALLAGGLAACGDGGSKQAW